MTTPNVEELIARNDGQRRNANAKPDVFLYADNITALQSQAERIKELELLVKVKNKPICDYQELIADRDALRAELATIAATEPVSLATDQTDEFGEVIYREVFTRPMPAQDVTGLVEALRALIESTTGVDQVSVVNDARTALSKYKGAK